MRRVAHLVVTALVLAAAVAAPGVATADANASTANTNSTADPTAPVDPGPVHDADREATRHADDASATAAGAAANDSDGDGVAPDPGPVAVDIHICFDLYGEQWCIPVETPGDVVPATGGASGTGPATGDGAGGTAPATGGSDAIEGPVPVETTASAAGSVADYDVEVPFDLLCWKLYGKPWCVPTVGPGDLQPTTGGGAGGLGSATGGGSGDAGPATGGSDPGATASDEPASRPAAEERDRQRTSKRARSLRRAGLRR